MVQRKWKHKLSIFVLYIVIFVITHLVNAQGFMVKPMTIDVTPHPNQTFDQTIELNNIRDQKIPIEVIPVQLLQLPSGLLSPIVPTENTQEKTNTRSCLDWISISNKTFEVPAVGTGSVTMRLKVPPDANGFYCAGLLIRTSQPGQTQQGKMSIGVRVQFLITIRVNVLGTPAREIIEPYDLELLSGATEENKRPVGSSALIHIRNSGETCGTLQTTVAVLRSSEEEWRRVTQVSLKRYAILPGCELALPVDLKRKLLPGRYRLIATVQISGRTGKTIDKVIDYKGDLGATQITDDVPFQLASRKIVVKALPGSLRSANITLTNPTEQPLRITCQLEQPECLRGVALGTLVGDDFSCQSWGKIANSSFLLPKGGRRTVQLAFRMPEDIKPLPYYYGNLSVQASYEDGQSAGDTQALVIVQNTQVEAQVSQATPVNINLTQGEDGHYIVTSKFANVGQVHFTPQAVATVTQPMGGDMTQVKMVTSTEDVLPLGIPEFSGILDFSKVPAGVYALKVTMTDGGKLLVDNRLPIRVELKDSKRIVTVIEAMPASDTNKTAIPPKSAHNNMKNNGS
ncbi:MAG TPA: hypothetical protein VHV83_01880 [Armatimonadota bacterium]|nr:hypothetical protein [Armatimonadota bacterium]